MCVTENECRHSEENNKKKRQGRRRKNISVYDARRKKCWILL